MAGTSVGAAGTYTFENVTANHTITASFYYVGSGASGGSGGGGSTTYTVTVSSNTENGTATASPKNESNNSIVTITPIPDEGYVLDTLTVTDTKGNVITLTDKGDGKFTFKMPGTKVTVEASFVEKQEQEQVFMDISSADYYYDAVLWAVEQGITSDTSATTFDLNDICTRGQIVTFLYTYFAK